MKYFLSIQDQHIISDAYLHCLKLAREHYENFPVASLFIPSKLRKHVAAVYAFARHADDIADEGSYEQDERKALLDDWRLKLHRSISNGENHPIYIALADTIKKFNLPIQLFDDLLNAFEQDITVDEYESFEDVLEYCQRSANPIGRLILHFFGCANDNTVRPADALCTGLQLANFWQDVAVDMKKPRMYLPRNDREKFHVTANDLQQQYASANVKRLIQFEVERTRTFFNEAKNIFQYIPFRLRLELKAIWRGGMKILDAIESSGYDTLSRRPHLRFTDKLTILLSSLIPVSTSKIVYARN